MERRGRGGGFRGGSRGGDRGGRDHGGFGGRGGGFGNRGGFDRPKPIKVGEEYDVKITDVGAKGDGITRVENFIVFVPGAKKGDEIRIRIKELARSFAIGEKIGEGSAKEEGDEKESEETEEAEGTEEENEEEESDESEDE